MLEEIRFANGMFRIADPDIEKPRHLTPQEKVAFDCKQRLLSQKAESRQETCWRYGCERKAQAWVREVGFDLKGGRAASTPHIIVSSSDYPGPVPGFCTFCLGNGPEELAGHVYFDRPEIHWGVTPTRWFVAFTDGTVQGGTCVGLNARRGLPIYTEEHVK